MLTVRDTLLLLLQCRQVSASPLECPGQEEEELPGSDHVPFLGAVMVIQLASG